MTARTPWDAFLAAVAHDPAAPRVTFYERTPGATQGERIELSGKVLLNWASKAANLLVEEFDVEPGSVVGVDLPLTHWRAVYWMLASWGAGATVVAGDAAQDASVADVTIGAENADVVVTLAALARSAPGEVPDAALDEARDLSTFADQFLPVAPADPAADAFPGTTMRELAAVSPTGRTHLAAPTPEDVFAGILGGGIVLVRGPVSPEDLEPLLRQEGLTS